MIPALTLVLSLQTPTPVDTTLEARLRAWREGHEAAVLTQFTELLSIPNVASDGPNIGRNADSLESLFTRRGFRVERWRAGGGPPILFGRLVIDSALPTITFYAHYDGQPVDPANWSSPPWTPTFRDAAGQTVQWKGGRLSPATTLHARSASDDKAPIAALLAALDAIADLAERPSVNVRVLLEGEEEAGSPNLAANLARHRARLASDAWVFIDGPMHQSGAPQVIFGVRGVLPLRLTTYGPLRPLHSGHYGNWAPNPTAALVQLLAGMRDDEGRILIDGFDETWRPPSAAELAAARALPAVDAGLRDELALGRTEGGGEGVAVRILSPAVNFDGLDGGPADARAGNRIPTSATAVLDFRLAGGQQPAAVRTAVEGHLRARGYTLVTEEPDSALKRNTAQLVRVQWGPGYPGVRTPPDHPVAAALLEVLTRGWGRRPLVVPALGGSLPLAYLVRNPDSPFLILPIVNYDNHQHAADENVRLGNLYTGIEVLGSLLVRAGPAMRGAEGATR